MIEVLIISNNLLSFDIHFQPINLNIQEYKDYLRIINGESVQFELPSTYIDGRSFIFATYLQI